MHKVIGIHSHPFNANWTNQLKAREAFDPLMLLFSELLMHFSLKFIFSNGLMMFSKYKFAIKLLKLN